MHFKRMQMLHEFPCEIGAKKIIHIALSFLIMAYAVIPQPTTKQLIEPIWMYSMLLHPCAKSGEVYFSTLPAKDWQFNEPGSTT